MNRPKKRHTFLNSLQKNLLTIMSSEKEEMVFMGIIQKFKLSANYSIDQLKFMFQIMEVNTTDGLYYYIQICFALKVVFLTIWCLVSNVVLSLLVYTAKPINIFQSEYKTSDIPIRLSYHDGNHYNAVIDPFLPTAGLGLGLPGLQPGLADRNQVQSAVDESNRLADDYEQMKLAVMESEKDTVDNVSNGRRDIHNKRGFKHLVLSTHNYFSPFTSYLPRRCTNKKHSPYQI